MVRNISLSLIFHLFMAGVYSYSLVKFGVEDTHPINKAICILAVILYIIFGFFVLKDTGSTYKNFISVLPSFILGLFVVWFCINGTNYHETNASGFGSIGWVVYWGYLSPFNIYLTFGNNMFGDIISGIFSIIPSFLFWLGISLKHTLQRRPSQ